MQQTSLKSKEYYISLQQGSEEWLQARKDFDLTASELGAAIGLGRFRTPWQLFQSKVLGEEELSPETEEIFEYGRQHEPVAVQHFSKHLKHLVAGRSFSNRVQLTETGIWPLHYDTFTLGVSPDRLVLKDDQLVASYEAKCPWGGKLSNPPHPEYLVQVHAQLQALDVNQGYLHCWTPDRSLCFRVTKNAPLWERIVHVAEGFVVRHLRSKNPPPLAEDSEAEAMRTEILKLLSQSVQLVE